MKRVTNSLAGLLLAVLVLVLGHAMGVHGIGAWAAFLTVAAVPALLGTVTVTYQWPVVGTVPPTVLQMKPLSLVTAAVNFGSDSDTLALITHNMVLGTIVLPTNPGSLVNETACLFPLVSWYYQSGGSTGTVLNGSIASSSVFQITKASAASGAGTINVFVLRPWTGIR
jgi:hypothetical protein